MRWLILAIALLGFSGVCGQGVGEKLPFPKQGHQFYYGIGGYLHAPEIKIGNTSLERAFAPAANNAWTIEPMDLTWFPDKHWGISVAVRIAPGIGLRDREEAIFDVVEERFGQAYNITSPLNSQIPLSQESTAGLDWFRFGLCYRIETENWILMPRLNFSWTIPYLPDQDFMLKEIDSNIWSTLEYKAAAKNPWFRSVSPALWLGRPLSRRFVLYTQVSYERPLVDVTYTERLTNLFSSNVSEENFNIKKRLNTVFWGFGLTFRMQGFEPRRDW